MSAATHVLMPTVVVFEPFLRILPSRTQTLTPFMTVFSAKTISLVAELFAGKIHSTANGAIVYALRQGDEKRSRGD